MRGVSYLQDLLTSLFERGEQVEHVNDSRSLVEICEALLSERGEVSGHLLASAALDRFESLDEQGRQQFFEFLSDRLDVDPKAVAAAASLYAQDASGAHYRDLMASADPKRQKLLRRLNSAPGATARLVAMREHLLATLPSNAGFVRTDMDFEHLFASWFNRGFLVMRPIDWQSPASLLEKIIAYEAVHEIDDWDDLRRRLQPADRRCFAFFHPVMPDEPLIFVEVALTAGIPDSIGEVLADSRQPIDPVKADTAVFYSISNCQHGLKGVSFGNFLIKQVAQELAEECPQLKSFVTLSPAPGLMRWVGGVLAGRKPNDDGTDTLKPFNTEKAVVTDQAHAAPLAIADLSPTIDPAALEQLQAIASGADLPDDAAVQKDLLACVSQYYCQVRRKDSMPIDPVARFHLGNGASLDRILLAADESPKGRQQSAGVMVNYRYEIAEIENRHQKYVSSGEVHVSKAVRGLLDHAAKSARSRKAKLGSAGQS